MRSLDFLRGTVLVPWLHGMLRKKYRGMDSAIVSGDLRISDALPVYEENSWSTWFLLFWRMRRFPRTNSRTNKAIYNPARSSTGISQSTIRYVETTRSPHVAAIYSLNRAVLPSRGGSGSPR